MDGIDDLADDFFTFTDDEGVDEGVHGLGVEAGMPAGNDERIGMPDRSSRFKALV